MTRSEALLKLLHLEPETRARLIAVTGWDADETEATLDKLVRDGLVTYRNGVHGATGERRYYPKPSTGRKTQGNEPGRSTRYQQRTATRQTSHGHWTAWERGSGRKSRSGGRTMLADDYARCIGRGHDGPGGEVIHPECEPCLRRQPVSERAMRVVMIAPSTYSPCPNRIVEGKHAAAE